MSDSSPHISPTATDQESLEYASEIAHNLVGGTYRSVPSYELRLAKAVIRLEEQLEATREALTLCGDLLFGTWDDDIERRTASRKAEALTRAVLFPASEPPKPFGWPMNPKGRGSNQERERS